MNRSTVRTATVEALQRSSGFDLVVIGGGATGCGVALDAAARGFSVVLLESDDFSQGTSSRATKLVHGGVRYLAQGPNFMRTFCGCFARRMRSRAMKCMRPWWLSSKITVPV